MSGRSDRQTFEEQQIVTAGNIDAREIDQFERIAAEWWDPNGRFKPLHALIPSRMRFIRQMIDDAFATPASTLKPLAGRSVLDVGCGGGLASEPLARLGGAVTGIDGGAETIAVARAHARQNGLDITYRHMTAEDLRAEHGAVAAQYDLVVALELIEHVPDPAGLIATLADLTRPGGLVVVSTLNRTAKSYALAIVAAEYVLGWLDRGTHDWSKFVPPEHLRAHLVAAGLEPAGETGITFDPISGAWNESSDMDVNYIMAARKPAVAALSG